MARGLTMVRRTVGGTAVAVAAAEIASWRVVRGGPAVAVGEPVAVVVFGYPSRENGQPHPVQRWRVAMAARTARATTVARVVCCGGAVRNEHVEADTMLTLARGHGIDDDLLVAERASRSTRENVANARPLVEGHQVLLVSDAFHARRARRLWLEQFPDDADRVGYGAVHRPLEHLSLKTMSATFELWLALTRARRARRAPPSAFV